MAVIQLKPRTPGQRFMQIAGCDAKPRNQAKEYSRDNRGQQRPPERGSVDAQLTQQRERNGALMRKPREQDCCEGETENSTDGGQHQALSE